jgi:hypothetical protein
MRETKGTETRRGFINQSRSPESLRESMQFRGSRTPGPEVHEVNHNASLGEEALGLSR